MINKIIKPVFALISCTLIFISCEKEVNIDLPQSEEKIVVEGWIEQNDYPGVIITKNSPYFAKIDSESLVKLLVLDAVVKIRDKNTGETEYLTTTINMDYFPPILYKSDSLKGIIGHTYELTIEVEGKTLTSTTHLLSPIKYDTIQFQIKPNLDSLGYIDATFSDNPAEGNYYRIYAKRLGKDKTYIPALQSIFEDRFFNGKTIEFSIERGIESYSDKLQLGSVNNSDFSYFKKGDTVVIKSCAIDRDTYLFWRTAGQDMMMGGNPFMSPINIISNVNGGLGVWGGYATKYDTVICK